MTAAVLPVLSPSFLSFRFYSLRWESLCKSLVHGNLETISSREKETAIHSSTPLPHHSINKNMPHSCYAVLFHRAKKLAAFIASQFCLILSLKGKIIWRSIVVLSLPGQQPAPAKICFWPIFTNRLYNNSVVVSSKSRGATAGRQRKCPGGVLQRLAGFNRE